MRRWNDAVSLTPAELHAVIGLAQALQNEHERNEEAIGDEAGGARFRVRRLFEIGRLPVPSRETLRAAVTGLGARKAGELKALYYAGYHRDAIWRVDRWVTEGMQASISTLLSKRELARALRLAVSRFPRLALSLSRYRLKLRRRAYLAAKVPRALCMCSRRERTRAGGCATMFRDPDGNAYCTNHIPF